VRSNADAVSFVAVVGAGVLAASSSNDSVPDSLAAIVAHPARPRTSVVMLPGPGRGPHLVRRHDPGHVDGPDADGRDGLGELVERF
jgi:hypothetical protein